MFYTLTHHGYEFVKTKISKLNKIAKKINQEPIQFELIKTEMETDPKTMVSQKMYYIMCIGEAPKLKDWKFMCQLEFTPKGNIFNTTYNYDAEGAKKIPDRFRTTPFTLCEDCEVERYRTRVFVLWNDKEDKWIQVGSTCLGAFLGVNESEVHQLAEFATTLATMPSFFKKVDAKTRNSNKNNSYHGYKIEDLFASLFSFMRELRIKRPYSWVSGYSYAAFKTFIYAPVLMMNKVKDSDKVMTETLLKYFRSGVYKPSFQNIFTDNMLVALNNDLISRRHYKFVREAFKIYINTFHNALFPVKKVERPVYVPVKPVMPQTYAVTQVPVVAPASVKTNSQYLGVIGSMVDLNLETTVTFSGGRFKRHTPLTLKDNQGNELYWWCPYFYKVNDKIKLNKAFIVKHREYNSVKQTVISEVNFTKLK